MLFKTTFAKKILNLLNYSYFISEKPTINEFNLVITDFKI